MLESALLLMMNGLLLMLRIAPGESFPKPLTQLETAEKCGISRSYVSRLEKRALEKLRHELEEGSGPAG